MQIKIAVRHGHLSEATQQLIRDKAEKAGAGTRTPLGSAGGVVKVAGQTLNPRVLLTT